jgi:hypothetical protein
MPGLGEYFFLWGRKTSGRYLQAHLPDNREEIQKVQDLNMAARDYTDVYERRSVSHAILATYVRDETLYRACALN